MIERLKWLYEKTVLRALRAIGFVNSLILLSLFYYFILGPMAFIREGIRLLKGDKAEKVKSYWQKREEESLEETLLRQF